MRINEDRLEDFKRQFHLTDGYAWKIKIDGEYVKMHSGKEVWKSEADARRALWNHVYYNEDDKEFSKILIDKGIIEFVNIWESTEICDGLCGFD